MTILLIESFEKNPRTLTVTLHQGGETFEKKLALQQFEAWVDRKDRNTWTMNYSDGIKTTPTTGKMSWPEYWEEEAGSMPQRTEIIINDICDYLIEERPEEFLEAAQNEFTQQLSDYND
jgi:hypothetical protein